MRRVPARSPVGLPREPASGVRYASGLEAVKARIKTVKNIKKITSAMKLVAASKLRVAQTATEASRGLATPLTKLIGDHPSLESSKCLTMAVTSDRGLCGGINSTVSKYTRAVSKMDGMGEDHRLVVVGEKGRSQLQRDLGKQFAMSITDTAKTKLTFASAAMIAEEVLKEEPEVVRMIFNRFVSAISYKPTVATALGPVQMQEALAATGKIQQYEMEGPETEEELCRDLAEFQMATLVFNSLLENNCSENASRMSAMESSTKNASEMIDKLSLSYNRARQAAITTELIEIISGAAALEG
ncbi:unnamed protein product [Pedinophyceae sp. YPF-701]|nr:unnamed protein product [Pedinophyceae sp. YPF-701]